MDIARWYIPAPRANFVRVVVNGESWGLFVNQQTFGKPLLREQLGTDAGTRWKSTNNLPGGGFAFLGDSLALYRRWCEQKGKDDPAAPLIALADTNKALRHRLLAVPALRTRYLRYVGEIAESWLDWGRLGPLVDAYVALIEAEVAADTRKHYPTEAFREGICGAPDGPPDVRTLRWSGALCQPDASVSAREHRTGRACRVDIHCVYINRSLWCGHGCASGETVLASGSRAS